MGSGVSEVAKGRRSIRLREYDYSQAGAYFVTICVIQRARRLGTIQDDAMVLSPAGQVVQHAIDSLATDDHSIQLGISCIMPNHVHLLLNFLDVQQDYGRGGVIPPLHMRLTLGQVIGKFKYATTKAINQLEHTLASRFWQRNYYERVVRNQTEYDAVYNYIPDNRLNWQKDEYF